MGKPCLVHRVKTERSDGLGLNARLSGMSVEALASFLELPEKYASEPLSVTHSPSDVIVADLVARGIA
jgi:UDP-N-acetylglucosamine 2-epimerase (non-hydrolysing)